MNNFENPFKEIFRKKLFTDNNNEISSIIIYYDKNSDYINLIAGDFYGRL